MSMRWLDHVNLRTANLAAMTHFYEAILGLKSGKRPPFGFGGAWHYCGKKAVVHLVEVKRTPGANDVRLEHFAFMAKNLAGFLKTLKAEQVAYEIAIVPMTGNTQVNIYDPDGNHIEVQFDASDKAVLDRVRERQGARPVAPRKKMRAAAARASSAVKPAASRRGRRPAASR
jgi:catechol 2,3-dioxygenase-like lactoylglutathione lyase family enzyme